LNAIRSLVRYEADFLIADHEILRAYLGDVKFQKLTTAFIGANPSRKKSERWYADHLVEFIKSYEPFSHSPEILELAKLERAMSLAFNAPDSIKKSKMSLNPSVSRLIFNHNTTSIWAALKCETRPPRPHALDHPQTVIVWRQRDTARFRLLGNEESAALDRVTKPLSLKSKSIEPYLRDWITAEIVVAPSLCETKNE
jgi:Putative DNA-binding domain